MSISVGKVSYKEFNNVKVLAESIKAIKILFSDGRKHWVPRSHVQNGFHKHIGDHELLKLSDWITYTKNLPFDSEEEPNIPSPLNEYGD